MGKDVIVACDFASREQTMAYDIITRPAQLLVLTCPRQIGGSEKRPAILWHRLEGMFPRIPRGQERTENRLLAPLPALELGAERNDQEILEHLSARPGWEDIPRRVEHARTARRGQLSPEGVEALYTHRVALSASKMDKLKSFAMPF